MKQTSKYQLNLIETSDRFLADPINENMQTIENVLQTVSDDHVNNKENPHSVTAAQVGAHSITSRGTTLIPSSSDLDNYMTPGDYYVASVGVAATITNAPTMSTGYKLIVEQGYGGNGHLNQYVIAAGPVIFARNHTSGSWSIWRKIIDSTSVDTTPTSGSTKMVTSGGVYTALSKKYGADNAGWIVGTYTGTGVVTEPTAVEVGFCPTALFILRLGSDTDQRGLGICLRSGNTQTSLASTHCNTAFTLDLLDGYLAITETGFTVTKPHKNYTYTLNEAADYIYLALK